jgi:hypothetical protein
MKTQKRFSILNYLVVLFAFGLLFSCEQLAPVEEPVAVLEEFQDLSGLTMEPEDGPINGRLIYSSDCESDCIEPGSGNYFAIKDSKSQSSGINTKKVSYKAYNTEDKFVVKVKYEVTSGPSQAKASIAIQINGKKKEFKSVPSGYTATFSIPLDKGWDKCDEVTFSIIQKGLGTPISFSENYGLIPVCEDEKALILWNKLGSLYEVENSEIGPNGFIYPEIDFGIAKFGKGVIPKVGWGLSGVDFPNSIFNPEHGTIEFWINVYHLPKENDFGVYGFVNNAYDIEGNLRVYWHNPNSLDFVLIFDGDGYDDSKARSIRYDSFSPNLNEPVHIAVVWDRNGIDDSDQTQRIYVNGELVSFGTFSDWGIQEGFGESRIATGWDWIYDESRFAMDNIKVWNYAKTDFSDRENEGN